MLLKNSVSWSRLQVQAPELIKCLSEARELKTRKLIWEAIVLLAGRQVVTLNRMNHCQPQKRRATILLKWCRNEDRNETGMGLVPILPWRKDLIKYLIFFMTRLLLLLFFCHVVLKFKERNHRRATKRQWRPIVIALLLLLRNCNH